MKSIKMESENNSSILQRFIIFLDNDRETAKLLGYGIATASLVVALYRVRPFAKFKKPSNLPSHFLRTRVPLEGTVMRIEPSLGTLLMVDHKPLIPIPRFGTPKYLPVKMAGIDVTNNGIGWLQTIISGKKITFVPVARNTKYVDCLVTMADEHKECLNIGEELVKLGFATVKEIPLKSIQEKDILQYQKCLAKAQKLAERKRNGYWHFTKHPTLIWKIQQKLSEKMKSVLPEFVTRQLNI